MTEPTSQTRPTTASSSLVPGDLPSAAGEAAWVSRALSGDGEVVGRTNEASEGDTTSRGSSMVVPDLGRSERGSSDVSRGSQRHREPTVPDRPGMRAVGGEADLPRLTDIRSGQSEGPAGGPTVDPRGASSFKRVASSSAPVSPRVDGAAPLNAVAPPHNAAMERGLVPRVKSNTDLAKARHSGRLDAPNGFGPSELERLRGLPRPIAGDRGQTPLDRGRRRVAKVSERLKARAVEELGRFPVEQAVAWFLAGVAVALALLIATT